ncbi:multidrug ABC transporter ATP-binding and permease protein [Secundilactobacillus pentosiphilus]|uniref:Multidrug ABC transporter ATP-binding and permease protein n=1 Tax=Secundilactobacillus pentosiphilus TaxID=1714682 RepID=A0A1Z5IW21_9LACO|nr:ABC transporter ATP-binding protein [Secundilactobacillus pentosiphilus]GAX05963.1 multidrug ABC transporter ATP-binding and permease protein [Secundilactobacillus pentosiphilus]
MTKLITFLKPYRTRITVMLMLLFAQTLGTLYLPTLTADIINSGIIKGKLNVVWMTGGMMLVVAFIAAVAAVWGTYLSTTVATHLGQDIRSRLFRRVQSFSTNDFNRFGAASLITRSTNDVTQVQQAFSIIVQMLLPAPFMTVAGLILAFSKDRLLAFMLLGFMIVILVAMALVAKKIGPLFERLQKQLDKINQTVRERIIGVRVIRAFNQTQAETKKTNQTFEVYGSTAIKANKIFAILLPLVMLMMNLLTVLFIWFGGQQVVSGNMAIGDIMAMIEYAVLTLMYLLMGVAVFLFIPRAQTCAKRIHAVLSVQPELTEQALQPQISAENKQAKVVFDHVTFSYKGAEQPVLQDVNFTLKKGQTTAIIGSTGAGKSTLIHLLMRLYDAQSGRILVDGRDVQSYELSDLRTKLGVVPQKAFLFSGTIATNLKHGNPVASVEDMHHAAAVAQIDDFIRADPRGLDQPVDKGGTNFSGGQRQRLAIARAIIKHPEIYVFDDSFSALDFKTDAKLRAALKAEVHDSATLIIAQRISTIIDADQIIVLDEGRIVGIGTHSELMQTCQVYQQIARSQFSEEELA